MAYGNNPTTGTQGALPVNQFPASSVYPPNTSGSNPTHDFKALGGGPIRTDDDGNTYSEALLYTKDGDNETLGAKSDTAATSGTGSWSAIALLKGILTKLLGTIAVSGTFWQATQPVSGSVSVSNFPATQPISGSVTETNSSAAKTDLDNISTVSGATTDVAVVGDNSGTVSAKLRGLSKIFNDVWDSVNHRLHVNVDNGNPNGQTTSNASAPVVPASDYVGPVKRNAVAAFSLASTTTSGSTQNSGDLTVGPYAEISIDINTTAQAGTNPTIQYFYERKGADGIYYVLWQSAVLTAAANTLSTSIGAGMAYNQSLGATGRLRWVIGGTATPTFTHSINIQGK